MKILRKLVCGVCAVVMCFTTFEIKADADAMAAETYYIGAYYVVHSNDVHTCQNSSYLTGDSYSWVNEYTGASGYWFNTGDVVYIESGYYSSFGSAAGITWGKVINDGYDYGWIDMSYLTPYDEYHAETEPPTEATTTTKATTTKATTTKKTTTASATLTTTEIQTTTKEKAPAVVQSNTNNLFSNKFVLIIMGSILVLLAISAVLVVLLVKTNKNIRKYQSVLMQENKSTEQMSRVKICPKCGEQHGGSSVFCRKCGTKLD